MPEWAYFDTSTIAKLYLKETGSATAKNLINQYNIVFSAISSLEFISVIKRRVNDKDIPEKSAEKILNAFRNDEKYYNLVSIGNEVLKMGEEVVAKTRCKTLDAIHIASSIIFQKISETKLYFLTSDKRQYEAAKQLGLTAEYVN